jgi:uncharacterized spore protein YtfJ
MQQDISNMQSAMGAQRVFGAPIRVDGTTLLPALAVRGGAGAGGGERGGAGFGVRARPIGVYAVRDGTIRWRPAVDVNRIIAGAQIVGLVVALAALPRFERRTRRRATWSSRFLARCARFRAFRALLGRQRS